MPPTSNKHTLFNLSVDAMALDAALADVDGDPSDNPALVAHIANLRELKSQELHEKVDKYLGLIKEKEARVAAITSEIDQLAMSMQREERDVKWLKTTLKTVLEAMGLQKAGHVRQATVCGNGGVVPIELLVEPEKLPVDYQIVTVTMKGRDWEDVKAMLDNDGIVPAAVEVDADTVRIRAEAELAGFIEGVAKVLPRGTHLRVK